MEWSKTERLVLFFVFLLAFLVRLYKIEAPLADWHSWRQADTAAVARNFVRGPFNLLYPRFDDLSNIASGKDNPEGYRFVEFPIYNAAHAFLGRATSGLISFEAAGRLVSIIFWLAGGWWLYLIVKLKTDKTLAALTLFFFFFLPYNIFYSRTILPEPMMVATALGSVYFFLGRKKLLSLMMAAISILIKPYAVFLIFPSFLPDFSVLFSLLPFAAWRVWMSQFPEGIPANSWLLNSGGIRLQPAWWRWLFAERLGRLILGCWGTALFFLGLVKKITRQTLLFWFWLAGGFAFLVIFAGGNVQHDYYQILLSPVVAVFIALGTDFLLKNKVSCFFIAFLIFFFLAFSWYFVKDYYSINHPEIIEAGNFADDLLPRNAKVVAPYGGDTTFLYHINRQGWPAVTYSMNKLIENGATHYVAVNFDETTARLTKNCQVLYRDPIDRFLIIDLRTCQKDAEL